MTPEPPTTLRARIRRSYAGGHAEAFPSAASAYWWLWVLIVAVAVALNEVFDRTVAGDKNGHPA
jgi:hypothetical protein